MRWPVSVLDGSPIPSPFEMEHFEVARFSSRPLTCKRSLAVSPIFDYLHKLRTHVVTHDATAIACTRSAKRQDLNTST